jgi:hypothetical protein
MATTVDSRRVTASLIGSDKVDGTPVYGADDRKIGSVQRVMIDKKAVKSLTPSFHSAASWEWVKTITRCRGRA